MLQRKAGSARDAGGTVVAARRFYHLPTQAEQEDGVSILGTLIIGLLAGIVAKLLMPGRDPGGFIITTFLGVAGAFVATYLGQAIGWYEAGQAAGFLGAVIGAVLILAAYRLVAGRNAA